MISLSALRLSIASAALIFAAPAVASTQFHAGVPDANARIVEVVPIDIPQIVWKAAHHGTVLGSAILTVDLAADGRLVRTAILRSSGNPWLDLSAATAVRHCRFEAERRHGMPVGGTYAVLADFGSR